MRNAWLVGGMKSGHEGKGRVVDWICSEQTVPLVVRYGGGNRSTNRVVTPQGRQHDFCYFGSGTFAGSKTYLGQHVKVEPFTILEEAAELYSLGEEDPLREMMIDAHCPIITPYHRDYYLGRLRGQPIRPEAEISYDLSYPDFALQFHHLSQTDLVRKHLTHLEEWHQNNMPARNSIHVSRDDRDRLVDFYRKFYDSVQMIENWIYLREDQDCMVFEGHSGALCDRSNGIHGHYDLDTTDFKQAAHMIKLHPTQPFEIIRIGVMRVGYDCYFGNPNARLHNYDKALTNKLAAIDADTPVLDGEEKRYGWLDVSLTVTGKSILAPNFLFMTHMDEWDLIKDGKLVNDSYHRDTPEPIKDYATSVEGLANYLSERTAVPLMATSHGPTRIDVDNL